MKHKIFILTFLSLSSITYAQQADPKKDSLDDLDYRKKQIQILEQELELKKEELELRKKEAELKKQDAELDREEKRIELERSRMKLEEEKENSVETKKEKETKKLIESDIKTKKDFKAAVFVEPLSFFVGGFQGGIESRLHKTDNLRLSCGYYYSQQPWYYTNADVMTGMKFDLQYRHYTPSVNPKKAFSFYYGLSLVYKFINITQLPDQNGPFTIEPPTLVGRNINPNFILGRQTLIGNFLLFDIWTAGGVNLPLESTSNNDVSIPFVNPYGQGVVLRFGVSIGVPVKN